MCTILTPGWCSNAAQHTHCAGGGEGAGEQQPRRWSDNASQPTLSLLHHHLHHNHHLLQHQMNLHQDSTKNIYTSRSRQGWRLRRGRVMLTSADTRDRWGLEAGASWLAQPNTTTVADIDTHQGHYIWCLFSWYCLEPPCGLHLSQHLQLSSDSGKLNAKCPSCQLAVYYTASTVSGWKLIDGRNLLQLWFCVRILFTIVAVQWLKKCKSSDTICVASLWKCLSASWIQWRSALRELWTASWVDPTLHGKSGLSKKFKQSRTLHSATMRKI